MRKYLTALSFLLLFCVPLLVAQDAEKNMAITLEDRDIDRFHEECARLEQGDVDILFVGDSITHFWDWEGFGKEVWNKYYGNRKAMNFGIGGDRTGHVLWRMENAPMEKISPKITVVMIGTNNVGHKSSTPEQTVQGIQMIVDRLKEFYPETKILLLNVFPREAIPQAPLRLAVNEINAGLSKIYANDQVEQVKLLDLGPLFLTKDGILPAEVMADFLHPGPYGYELWGAAIEPYIVEALGEEPVELKGAPREGQWWMDRFNEKKGIIEAGNIDLLMIGDSITHFWETVPELWDKYYGDKKAINMGISGDRTQEVIWRLENYPMDKISPKAATVLIGVNNLAHNGSRPQDVALGIRKIVSILKEKYPEIKITVLKVFPWGSTEEKAKKQDQVDQLNLCIEPVLLGFDNVQVLDLTPMFLDLRGALTPTVMSDLVHPNPFGYEIWGNAMDAVTKEMLQ